MSCRPCPTCSRARRLLPPLRRRHPELLTERGVESAQAAEAARVGDKRDRIACRHQKPCGVSEANGQGELKWRRTELARYGAAQMAIAHTQVGGEISHRALIELASGDSFGGLLRMARHGVNG